MDTAPGLDGLTVIDSFDISVAKLFQRGSWTFPSDFREYTVRFTPFNVCGEEPNRTIVRGVDASPIVRQLLKRAPPLPVVTDFPDDTYTLLGAVEEYLVAPCDTASYPRQIVYFHRLEGTLKAMPVRSLDVNKFFDPMKLPHNDIAAREQARIALRGELQAVRHASMDGLHNISQYFNSLRPSIPPLDVRATLAKPAQLWNKDPDQDVFHALAKNITFTQYRAFTLHNSVFDASISDFFRRTTEHPGGRIAQHLPLFDNPGSSLVAAFEEDSNPLVKLEAIAAAFEEIRSVYRIHIDGDQECPELIKTVFAYVNPPFVASVFGFLADFVLESRILTQALRTAAIAFTEIIVYVFGRAQFGVEPWILSRRVQESAGIIAYQAETKVKEDELLKELKPLENKQRGGLAIEARSCTVVLGPLYETEGAFAPLIFELRKVPGVELSAQEKRDVVVAISVRDRPDKVTHAKAFFKEFPNAKAKILIGKDTIKSTDEPQFTRLSLRELSPGELKNCIASIVTDALQVKEVSE
jgi:hypothetical protein